MRYEVTRRDFIRKTAAITGLTCLGAAMPTPIGAAEAPIASARLTIAHPKRFRILQITDLHYFAGDKIVHESRNRGTTEIIRQLIAGAKPDLLMATGDLWPENRDGKGEERMRYVVHELESFGLPWAYTWGNHDQLPDFAAGHKVFREARNSLYRGDQSNGNYVIDVMDEKGRRVWQLVCLNTTRDGLAKEQQQWLETLRKADPQPVPRVAFFHIPLKQYEDIWENGAASGIFGESVCKEKEDGSSLAFLKALDVKACFCGHDHVNDYSGRADGIELVYGRATGLGGYGSETVPKGGKLITLNSAKGSCEWVTLTPKGKPWHPKPGERIDKSDEKK